MCLLSVRSTLVSYGTRVCRAAHAQPETAAPKPFRSRRLRATGGCTLPRTSSNGDLGHAHITLRACTGGPFGSAATRRPPSGRQAEQSVDGA